MSLAKYDPFKHHRRSIRLAEWDYRTPGAYFITICTHQQQYLFTQKNLYDIVYYTWLNIPTHPHATHVALDEFVIMPNHMHLILVLLTLPNNSSDALAKSGAVSGSLAAIVGNFKSVTARRINNVRRQTGSPVWQQGYYERIIRHEREFNATRTYIRNNPLRWAENRDNLHTLTAKMHNVLD